MPAAYSHLMITEKAIERLKDDQRIDPELRKAVLTHSHFVHLGSLGPDYPYLDFFQYGQTSWADHFHNDHTGDTLQTMAHRLSDSWETGLEKETFLLPFCWALGYLSHVTGDCMVHPVIDTIVGPYDGNETRHRHCEMIQDVFIYHKIRRGAEIEHGELARVLQLCSKPDDGHKLHPILRLFWEGLLRDHFQEEFKDNPPRIDQWHDQFEGWIGLAGRPLYVGRIIDPGHQFTYKRSSELDEMETMVFLNILPLPNHTFGSYEDDVFPKAIDHVVEKWALLARGLTDRDFSPFLGSITNCDLHTGRDLDTGKFVYW
jgi:hypothetical protein